MYLLKCFSSLISACVKLCKFTSGNWCKAGCWQQCFVFPQKTDSCSDQRNVRLILLEGISRTASCRRICAVRRAAACLETTTPSLDSTRTTTTHWTKVQKNSRLNSPRQTDRITRWNPSVSAPGQTRSLANPEGPGLRSRTSSWWLWRTSLNRRDTCPCANAST